MLALLYFVLITWKIVSYVWIPERCKEMRSVFCFENLKVTKLCVLLWIFQRCKIMRSEFCFKYLKMRKITQCELSWNVLNLKVKVWRLWDRELILLWAYVGGREEDGGWGVGDDCVMYGGDGGGDVFLLIRGGHLPILKWF